MFFHIKLLHQVSPSHIILFVFLWFRCRGAGRPASLPGTSPCSARPTRTPAPPTQSLVIMVVLTECIKNAYIYKRDQYFLDIQYRGSSPNTYFCI